MRDDRATVNAHETLADQISLFEVGGVLLRRRWTIARWMFVGAILAFLPVMRQKVTYTSTTTFVPQGAPDPGQSGIRSLAGQFGLNLGSANQGQSPEFYRDLLETRSILAPIAVDTFETSAGRRGTLIEILDIKAPTPAQRLDAAIQALRGMIGTGISRETGVLTTAVTTTDPKLSFAIAAKATENVNNFNLRKRQTAASEERRFTETRLADAQQSLRAAEERLQSFLQRNRQFQTSSDLSFERDRLQRAVNLQQEIVESLARTYEDVRVREIRDLPVITVIEEPALPTQANPRGRLRRVAFGAFVGLVMGSFLVLIMEVIRRRRQSGDPQAGAFFQTIADVRAEFARLIPGRSRRASTTTT